MNTEYSLIGTDEAGYGPFLGPLAVTATLWDVDAEIPPEMIYAALSPTVGVSPKDAAVAVTDSKKLYKTSVYKSLSGISPVEKTVLSMMAFLNRGTVPENIFEFLCGDASREEREKLPWGNAELPFPLAHTAEEIGKTAEEIGRKMHSAGVFLRAAKSDLAFPERFNRETEISGSKGVFLMETTLKLAADFTRMVREQNSPLVEGNFAPRDIFIFCDKLGGRNFYLAPLTEFFPGTAFAIIRESRDVSEYVHRDAAGTLTVRFQAKGESNIAVALASLMSKYLRELSMLGFNAWWREKIPGLRPTEGYPEDARRFLADIQQTAETLGIPREIFWRNR